MDTNEKNKDQNQNRPTTPTPQENDKTRRGDGGMDQDTFNTPEQDIDDNNSRRVPDPSKPEEDTHRRSL